MNVVLYEIPAVLYGPAKLTIRSYSEIFDDAQGAAQFQGAAAALAAELVAHAPGGFCDALAAELVRRTAADEVR